MHYSYEPKEILSKRDFDDGGIPKSGTSFVRSPERINVAFSRAQNLLIVLGNRYTLYKNDVKIKRDDKTVVRKQIFKQIQQVIGKGGMIDSTCSEDSKQAINLISPRTTWLLTSTYY